MTRRLRRLSGTSPSTTRWARPFDDGGLAHAGLADQDRVVLGPATQHLDDPTDLVVSADDRVELAGAGVLGQVAAVLLQGLVLGLGVLAGDPMRAPDLLEGGQQLVT